ncbi:hypothetical protein L1049_018536 [Liquidambar formosana]|uniref:Uncharacterized protein n=1 Tax=Liquidambar formosana TaxID=63359 RepID=A0AAP0RA84_LIQFO
MMLCSSLRNRIQPWLRDYDSLQYFAVILLYVQIGCALLGSLGALYNGVSLINLAISLFALVAIESSSQSLGRAYAFLLFCAILLDIAWFVLFSSQIWNISSKDYGIFFIFSLKLTLSMQIVGFFVRLSSSLLWIQMYRLGVSHLDAAVSREADFDLRNSFLNPATPAVVRQSSDSDDVLGGSIYDPAYYSSLFEDGQDNGYSYGGQKHGIGDHGSTSVAEPSQLKPSISRSSQAVDVSSCQCVFLIFYGHLVTILVLED